MLLQGYGGHSWVRMGIVGYTWGIGHGKEAMRVTDGHCGSLGRRSWTGKGPEVVFGGEVTNGHDSYGRAQRQCVGAYKVQTKPNKGSNNKQNESKQQNEQTQTSFA